MPKSKEKSLGFLAIGFIKLFLGLKCTIPLDHAAERLTHVLERHKLKTKIRRLYDIANVFLALGIIKKAYMPNRKPAFEWMGVPGLKTMLTTLNKKVEIGGKQLSCSTFKMLKRLEMNYLSILEDIEIPAASCSTSEKSKENCSFEEFHYLSPKKIPLSRCSAFTPLGELVLPPTPAAKKLMDPVRL